MRKLSPDEYNSEFERNYKYYRQRMERRLVKQVYDRERFDDICQDAFVRALTYLARQDEEKLPQTDYHLGNLLSIMAIQVAIDDGRKDKSKDYSYLSDMQLPELMVEGHENRICNLEEFQEAIAQLPLKEREPLLWKYRDGYAQKEIAAKLGISEAAVSMNVNSGKAQLRQTIYPVTIDLKARKLSFTAQQCEYAASLFDERTYYQNEKSMQHIPEYREYELATTVKDRYLHYLESKEYLLELIRIGNESYYRNNLDATDRLNHEKWLREFEKMFRGE